MRSVVDDRCRRRVAMLRIEQLGASQSRHLDVLRCAARLGVERNEPERYLRVSVTTVVNHTRPWYRLPGRPMSESGTVCRGDESHGGGVPVTVKKAKRRTANAGLASAQASVTKLVTHVAQHDAIGRNMALRRPCAFDIATR